MSKRLVTSIGQLCQLSGNPKLMRERLRDSNIGIRCLLLGKVLKASVPVVAVLAGSGRNAIFRLIQASEMGDIGMVQQSIAPINSMKALQRALAIVLDRGVVMGTEKYIRPKVFLQREQPPKAHLKLVPPKVTKKAVVLRRELFQRGQTESQIRPLW